MFHIITENIDAFRRAVQDTTVASLASEQNPNDPDLYKELCDCSEEERIRYEGLVSVIVMVIKAAAADDPHNPFSINDDVNQPDEPPVRPRSRLAQAMAEDPQVRTKHPSFHTPPPRREE